MSASISQNPGAVFPYRTNQRIFFHHQNSQPAMPVIVSHAHKLAYVYVPKNACTSLKLFFYELMEGCKYKKGFRKIHGEFNHAACDFRQFSADKAHFKFLIVRDPVERFISAYNNRVLLYNELSKAWFMTSNPNYKDIFAYFEEHSLKFSPDIGEFIRHLHSYIELNHAIRHHMIPQHYFFHGKPDIFDRVYHMGQLAELERDLGARIGRTVEFPRVQETKSLKNKVKITDLGLADRNWLKEFYKEDYRILGPYL
jgi:hypothetical protein